MGPENIGDGQYKSNNITPASNAMQLGHEHELFKLLLEQQHASSTDVLAADYKPAQRTYLRQIQEEEVVDRVGRRVATDYRGGTDGDARQRKRLSGANVDTVDANLAAEDGRRRARASRDSGHVRDSETGGQQRLSGRGRHPRLSDDGTHAKLAQAVEGACQSQAKNNPSKPSNVPRLQIQGSLRRGEAVNSARASAGRACTTSAQPEAPLSARQQQGRGEQQPVHEVAPTAASLAVGLDAGRDGPELESEEERGSLQRAGSPTGPRPSSAIDAFLMDTNVSAVVPATRPDSPLELQLKQLGKRDGDKPILKEPAPLAAAETAKAAAQGVTTATSAAPASQPVLMQATPQLQDTADGLPPGRRPGTAQTRTSSGATLKHDVTYEFDEFVLQTYSWPRRLSARLCGHPDFEFVVVLVIFGNLLTLALYRPTEAEGSTWNTHLFWTEAAFNVAFTVEMLLRATALGGVLQYLRHPWNVFDALMVAAGYVAFIPTGSDSSGSGVRALRALRALRPLRTVTRFESLRAIVVCFMEAVPLLGSAVGVMLLFMLVFAVAGTNIYSNIYHQKCYSDLTGLPEESEEDADMLGCGDWRSCPVGYTCTITKKMDAVSFAGFDNVATAMLSVFQCITLTGWTFAFYRTTDNTNPVAAIYYVLLVAIGAYVLVNLFLAVLKIKFAKAQTAFRARNAGKTRTRRNSVMSFFMAAKSKFSEYSAKKSQAHTLNASIANLISTRMSQYSSVNSHGLTGPATAALAEVADASEVDGAQPVLQSSAGGLDGLSEPGNPPPAAAQDGDPGRSPMTAVAPVETRTPSRLPSGRLGCDSPSRQHEAAGPERKPVPFETSSHDTERRTERGEQGLGQIAPAVAGGVPVVRGPVAESTELTASPSQSGVPSLGSLPALPACVGPSQSPAASHHARNAVVPLPLNMPPPAIATGSPRTGRSAAAIAPVSRLRNAGNLSYNGGNLSYNGAGLSFSGAGGAGPRGSYLGGPGNHSMSGVPGMPSNPEALMGANMAMAAMMMDPAEFDDFIAGEPPLRRLHLKAMFRARLLCNSVSFSYFMLAIIVANTVLLALEYDGMSSEMESALRNCNYAFTALFTLEMGVKLFGLGFWDYVKDSFNLFDAIVVIMSWLEIILTQVGAGSSLNAMAALRAFRALRLLKAFRYLGTLRRIAALLLAAFASFAAIAVLIALFWVVFSIVGMHVFGGLELKRYPYPNFDTFLNAMVTTFNILTLENYQNNMYDTVRATNYGAALFFMAWIVIGKYILLTLFLAVTLEAFEAKYDIGKTTNGSWTARVRSAVGSAVGSMGNGSILGAMRRSIDRISTGGSYLSSGTQTPQRRTLSGPAPMLMDTANVQISGVVPAGVAAPEKGQDQWQLTAAVAAGSQYGASQAGGEAGESLPARVPSARSRASGRIESGRSELPVPVYDSASSSQACGIGRGTPDTSVHAGDAAATSAGLEVRASRPGPIAEATERSDAGGGGGGVPPRGKRPADKAAASKNPYLLPVASPRGKSHVSAPAVAPLPLRRASQVVAGQEQAGAQAPAMGASAVPPGVQAYMGHAAALKRSPRKPSRAHTSSSNGGLSPLPSERSSVVGRQSVTAGPAAGTAASSGAGSPETVSPSQSSTLQAGPHACEAGEELGSPKSPGEPATSSGAAGRIADESGDDFLSNYGLLPVAPSADEDMVGGPSPLDAPASLAAGAIPSERPSPSMFSPCMVMGGDRRSPSPSVSAQARLSSPPSGSSLRSRTPTRLLDEVEGLISGPPISPSTAAQLEMVRSFGRNILTPPSQLPNSRPSGAGAGTLPYAVSMPAHAARRQSIDSVGSSHEGSGVGGPSGAWGSFADRKAHDEDLGRRVLAHGATMATASGLGGGSSGSGRSTPPLGYGRLRFLSGRRSPAQGGDPDADTGTADAPEAADDGGHASTGARPSESGSTVGGPLFLGPGSRLRRGSGNGASSSTNVRGAVGFALGRLHSVSAQPAEPPLPEVEEGEEEVEDADGAAPIPPAADDDPTDGVRRSPSLPCVTPSDGAQSPGSPYIAVGDVAGGGAASDNNSGDDDSLLALAALTAASVATADAAAEGGDKAASNAGSTRRSLMTCRTAAHSHMHGVSMLEALVSGAGPCNHNDLLRSSSDGSRASMGSAAAVKQSPFETPAGAASAKALSIKSPSLEPVDEVDPSAAGTTQTPSGELQPPAPAVIGSGPEAGSGRETAAASVWIWSAVAVPPVSDPNAVTGPFSADAPVATARPLRARVMIELPPGTEAAGGAPGERGNTTDRSTAATSAAAAGGLSAGGKSRQLAPEEALQAMESKDSLNLADRADSLAPSVATSAGEGGERRTRSGRTPRAAGDGDGGKDGKKRPSHNNHRIPFEGKSLFYFDTSNRYRRKTYRFINGRPFEYSLLIIIVLNCALMTIEGPNVRPESDLGLFLYWGNAGFTIIFALEMLVKVFAWGFVLYIKDITNQVDFVVVVTGLLELALTMVDLSAVSALRALRALKPLRLLTRSAGMRLVFKSVLLSLGAMAHVSVLVAMFLLIFAILGVQLFSGRFYSCNDTTVSGRDTCVGSYVDVATNGTVEREWSNLWPNFDNVGNALLSCFVVATLNGYAELMEAAMAAPSVKGHQPRPNANPAAFLWFVGFVVVVAFTLLNLYVGVIFSQFSKIRNLSVTGSAFLTNEQQEWVELSKMVFRLKPPEKSSLPRGRTRLRVYRLVLSSGFERFMMGVIIANVVLLAATWYGEPQAMTDAMGHVNIAFTAIYTLEAGLKLYGLGRKAYFKDTWNRFDFVLVVAGILDVALSFLHTGFLRVLRIFRLQRLLRVMRLLRKSKGIKTLFQALVMSLPAFGNVGALIGLFFFMYGYVGVMLFGKVRQADDAAINRSVNFSNFLYALSALFRVATGDNWTDVMFGLLPIRLAPPDCDRSAGNCGTWLALPYFLTFFLLIAVIMLNLFTAVIIENFEKTHEQDAWRLTPQNLEDFVVLWSEYDDGSGTIEPRQLEELLLRLDPPLGLGPYADNKEVLRFVYDLDIPLVAGRVPFHKTAFELVKRTSQAAIPEGQLKAQLEALIDAFFRDLSQPDEQMRFNVAVSVMLIQRRWRTRMRANRMRKKRAHRANRRGAPPYMSLVHEREQLAAAFYREPAPPAPREEGAVALAPAAPAVCPAQRWRFNSAVTPPAVAAALGATVAAANAAARRRGGFQQRMFRMVTGRFAGEEAAEEQPPRGVLRRSFAKERERERERDADPSAHGGGGGWGIMRGVRRLLTTQLRGTDPGEEEEEGERKEAEERPAQRSAQRPKSAVARMSAAELRHLPPVVEDGTDELLAGVAAAVHTGVQPPHPHPHAHPAGGGGGAASRRGRNFQAMLNFALAASELTAAVREGHERQREASRTARRAGTSTALRVASSSESESGVEEEGKGQGGRRPRVRRRSSAASSAATTTRSGGRRRSSGTHTGAAEDSDSDGRNSRTSRASRASGAAVRRSSISRVFGM